MHYLDHIKAIFLSLAHFVEIKLVGAFAWGIYTFLFGFDLNAAMLALIALMVFDLLTGTAAAAMDGGEGISSRRAAKTPIKFGVYLTLVSAAHLTDSAVFGVFYIQETMVAFLALTELISIIENAAKMGYGVPSGLLSRLKSMRDNK